LNQKGGNYHFAGLRTDIYWVKNTEFGTEHYILSLLPKLFTESLIVEMRKYSWSQHFHRPRPEFSLRKVSRCPCPGKRSRGMLGVVIQDMAFTQIINFRQIISAGTPAGEFPIIL